MTRPRLLARPALAGVVLGLLWVLLGPAAPAAAHAYLLSSQPAHEQVLDAAPEQVLLSFSESVQPVADQTLVVGPDGERVDTGEPYADGPELIIPLGDGAGARGSYLVSYRVISADGHPVPGGITFSIGAPSETPPVPSQEDVDDPGLRAAMSIARYVGYAGLVLVIGPAVVLSLLWPHRLPRQVPTRLVWLGAGLITVSALVVMWLQAPYTTGKPLPEVGAADIGDVLGSTFGQAHLVRLAVLAAAVWLLRPVLAGRGRRTDLVLLAGLGMAALATWPASGHPVSSPLPTVSMTVMIVHLGAAAFWIGGLVMLAGFLLPRANARELGALVPAWSGWAAAAVAALLLAGVIQALLEAGTPAAVVTTTYGRLLIGKVMLVVAVIAVASYSRRLVRRRLAAARPRAMRVAIALEAAVLAVVVGFSAVLVQTTPARTEAAAGEGAAGLLGVVTTLDSDLYSLEVTVDPAEVGGNTVHLYAFTPDGQPQPVEEWRATAALPEAGIEPIEVELQSISDNHVLGELSMPVAGDWEMRFTVRVSEIDQDSVSTTVPIDEP